jgi:hypothetical protein
MTKDDIISMALEAGFSKDFSGIYYSCGGAAADSDLTSPLERFAELLEAKVRKECAALCSATAAGRDAEAIEEAILARGEK